MKTRMNYLSAVIFGLTVILVAACGSDDGAEPVDVKTNTDFLTDSRWYLESSNDASVNEIGSAWFFDFVDNNTWSGKTPGENGLADASGSWEFNSDESQLIISEDVDITTLTIITLNESIFKFTVEMNSEITELTFDHVQ